MTFKDPKKTSQANEVAEESAQKSDQGFIRKFIFTPFVDMVKAIFSKRPYGLHFLIALQFFLYASNAFTWESYSLMYLYMQKTFDISGSDYSRYSAFLSSKFTLNLCFKFYVLLILVIVLAITPILEVLDPFFHFLLAMTMHLSLGHERSIQKTGQRDFIYHSESSVNFQNYQIFADQDLLLWQ